MLVFIFRKNTRYDFEGEIRDEVGIELEEVIEFFGTCKSGKYKTLLITRDKNGKMIDKHNEIWNDSDENILREKVLYYKTYCP